MIRPLASLRFLAAFMVVAHHYFGFWAGYAGVSFFFVLSGFVLALNYRREQVESSEQRRAFWVKRFARVYPTHLLTLVLMLPIGISIPNAAVNVLLLQSWFPLPGVYFGYNGPAWSISNEAFFYAAFPVLFALARPKVLLPWAAALVLLALAFAIVPENPGLSNPAVHFLFYIFPPARLFEFVLGMTLASLPARRVGLGGEIIAITLAVSSMALAYAPLPGSFAAALIFIPGAAAMIYAFAHSEGPIAKLLGNSFLVLLGGGSYALYMLHRPLEHYVPLASGWLTLIAVVLSVVFHKVLELPAKAWLERRLLPRTEATG